MTPLRNLLICGAASLFLAASAQAAQSTADNSPAMAPIALNSLSGPPDKIATAQVFDDHGMIVGAVQKVELDLGGKPARVEIALLGTNRIVALDSARLSYDQTNNILTAELDKSEIGLLPSAG